MSEITANAAMTSAAALRCAIYTRSATDAKEAVAGQQRECEAWLHERLGDRLVIPVRTYADGGCSGLDMQRPELQRMVADVEAGTLDLVLVVNFDRISRSPNDLARVLRLLAGSRTTLISVREGAASTFDLDASEHDDA